MAPHEPKFELAHAAARPLPPVDVPVAVGAVVCDCDSASNSLLCLISHV